MEDDPAGPDPTVTARMNRFRILGPLEVVGPDGGAIALGGPRQRAVLAHLLIREGQVVPADVLVDEVWGEAPPATARGTLQTYVSHLRRVLGTGCIRHHPPGYRIDIGPDALDARSFAGLVAEGASHLARDPATALARLDQALALWRGPAFADLAADEAIAAHAARLDAERMNAREHRAEALLALGWASQAVDVLEGLLADHPYEERAWGLLMLAAYRAGRQRDALDAFLRVRRLLDRELGVEPSPPLVDLQRRILRHDPGLQGPSPQVRGYRVVRTLGEGRLGSRVEAIDPVTGLDVVIESVRPAIASAPGFVRRFATSARAVARLDHPAICAVLDSWRDGTGAWVVTESPGGRRLLDHLDGGGVPPPSDAVAILERIAAALDHAHGSGVSHGAVASCVELDRNGDAVLGGFWMGDGPRPAATDDLRQLCELAERLLPDAHIGELGGGPVAASGAGLVELVRQATGLAADIAQPPVAVRNPYKGLRSFQESDRADFFGRDLLVRRIVERVGTGPTGSPFLAVVGPSGAGKSSVLGAGVVPTIRAGAIWEPDRTWVVWLTPGDRPRAALESSMRVALAQPVPALRTLRTGGPAALRDSIRAGLPRGAGCVLVIDRFEELFLEGPQRDECDWFLGLLGDTLGHPAESLRIVVAVRADRYDLPLQHPALGEWVAAHSEVVPPLAPDELEAAIRSPADLAGVRMGPGLLGTLVADAAHRTGAQPFLQYALTELFERRTEGMMTLDAYRAMGGITGAVTSSADALLASLDDRVRQVAREVFLRLVVVEDGRPGVRHAVPRSELDRPGLDAAEVDGILDLFGRHRLLTSDRDPLTREPTVELAHDALIDAWRTLADWVAEATDDLRQERALGRAAADWLRAGRDTSFLLRGARLERLEAWARGATVGLGEDERSFLDASVRRREDELAEERERQRRERLQEQRSRTRTRRLATALGVLLLVALVATGIAVQETGRSRANARLAAVGELAGAAMASISDDPEQGLLLAMEAFWAARDDGLAIPPAVEQALHDTMAVTRATLTLPGVAGQVAWGPDDRLIATGSDTPGAVVMRRAATGKPVVRTDVGVPITDVAFAPDRSLVAVADEAGRLHVLDARSLDERLVVQGLGPATGVSWGTAGTVAAAWPEEHAIRVIDASDGSDARRIEVPDPWDTSLAPDGASIAVVAHDVVVLDVATGLRLVPRLVPVAPLSGVAYPVSQVAWSPDGAWIATTSMGAADLWDAATGGHVRVLEGHVGGVESVAWSSDSRLLVTGGGDGTARGWTLAAGEVQPAWTMRARAVRGGVLDVALAPDGDRLLAAGVEGATVWEVDGSFDSGVSSMPAVGFYGDVAFVPEESAVVGVDRGGRLVVRDPRTGEVLRSFGPPFSEHWFDLAPDGSAIAVGRGSGPAVVLDMASGAVRFSVDKPDAELAWSPEGSELAVGDTIVDRDGAVLGVLELAGYDVREPRYSPDGRYIVTSGDAAGGSLVVIWDRAERRMIRSIEAETMDVAIDPSSRLLATDGRDVRPPAIWDLTTGHLVRTIAESVGPVLDVAFHPDGTRLATAGRDGVVRLYDVATGTEVLALRGHRDEIRTVVFDRMGDRLASQGPGEIRVWTLDPDALMERGRSMLTRSLTEEECRHFLRAACRSEG